MTFKQINAIIEEDEDSSYDSEDDQYNNIEGCFIINGPR